MPYFDFFLTAPEMIMTEHCTVSTLGKYDFAFISIVNTGIPRFLICNFQFNGVYISILFSIPLVLLSNLDLSVFCFHGFFMCPQINNVNQGMNACTYVCTYKSTAIPYRASTGPEQGFPCVVFPHREH